MNSSILQQERIRTLDIIRGIAILGIFLVNIPDMLGNSAYHVHNWSGPDKYVRFFYDLFVQTKFYTIFSFLFGLGFYIFMSRAEAKGLRYNVLFGKRIFFLFVFGVIHCVFLWRGDILHTYAMGGLFLLLFYRCEINTIKRWTITFFIIAHTFGLALMQYASVIMDKFPQQPHYFVDWTKWAQVRASELFGERLLGELLLLPEILALFLFGFYIGKKSIFSNVENYRTTIRKWQLVSLAIGIVFSIPIINGFLSNDIYVSKNYYAWILLSGKALAVFYVTTIMLAKAKWLRYFGYVGQMALTNYMMHTLVGVVLLSGLLKQTGNMSLMVQAGIVAFVYIVQICISKWWLSRYRFGPLEWLWRTGTYGKVQQMKKRKGSRNIREAH
ncbi:DUF418 domain-containing protein [Priestia taiwanensis]|uniref:Membrane protein n=1 Tax=Priestia taiwanensis TaxID=1347902 RepID=A0A917END7_9BACI|nr:DUF418 domain-containing protein [Priestia taiwanensis]MBM7362494.1 uncharacterized protein [Priestia taiwanensis]GGE62664.1 membrane protein [Priestia taiwanensis]